MPVGITDLAHSLRKNTAGTGAPISLSHGQQLICAALGHNTLASFQAAKAQEREPQDFEGVAHIALDHELLGNRADQLGVGFTHKRLVALVNAAFEERLPETRVHDSFFSFAMHIQDRMQDLVISDDGVNSEMANANYDGVDEVYLEEEVDPDKAEIGEPMQVTIPGQVNLGIDTERPYSGHQVDVEVAVTLTRCGRRCFEDAEMEVVSASLDQDWGGDRDDEPRPQRTLAQALAQELNIDVAEAEQLTDVEAQELTGSSGEMAYSYLFDFTGQVSPELAARLMQQHGSLQLEVGPWFFDGIRPAVRE